MVDLMEKEMMVEVAKVKVNMEEGVEMEGI